MVLISGERLGVVVVLVVSGDAWLLLVVNWGMWCCDGW